MNTKRKALLAFVTIFILGAASGYFMNDLLKKTGIFATSERYEFRERGPQGRWQGEKEDEQNRARGREWAENRLSRHLELNDGQKEEFFVKMFEYHQQVREKISEHRSEEMNELRSYYSRFRDDVAGILTENQLQKLDSAVHPDSVHRMRMERLRGGRNR